MPLKERKKRGVVRNCSKNYITNCIIIQLLVYRNTILLKKKRTHTHTLLKTEDKGNIFGHANLLNFATIFFFWLWLTHWLFLRGVGGLREEKLDAEAMPM